MRNRFTKLPDHVARKTGLPDVKHGHPDFHRVRNGENAADRDSRVMQWMSESLAPSPEERRLTVVSMLSQIEAELEGLEAFAPLFGAVKEFFESGLVSPGRKKKFAAAYLETLPAHERNFTAADAVVDGGYAVHQSMFALSEMSGRKLRAMLRDVEKLAPDDFPDKARRPKDEADRFDLVKTACATARITAEGFPDLLRRLDTHIETCDRRIKESKKRV